MPKPAKMELPLTDDTREEILKGLMLAELAITDSKPGTLSKVCKSNPWHLEALNCITGSEEQSHRPLRTILKEDMDGLELDWELDVGGITKGGHFLDTQGYIAHNDDTIVISFRCTTSAYDWLTNFNATSSAWELEEDIEQGYSGFCSGLEGLCCTGGTYKPRVHTGFYNNFLAVLPTIKRHIDPLLKPYERPRKLFIVGHSLGAGIATLAGCYFMTEYHWTSMRQQLVIVTAGSPRAVCNSMKKVIDAKRQEHGNKCRMYRVVKGKDMVTSVPPKVLGFTHLIDPIKITDEGKIVLRTKEDDPEVDLLELTKFRNSSDYDHLMHPNEPDRADISADGDDEESTYMDPKTKYDRMISRVPKSLRDHMPDFYLKPLLKSVGLKYGSSRPAMRELRLMSSLDENEDKTNNKEEKDSVDRIALLEEKPIRKKRNNEPWVPRMFRNKRTAPAAPLYF